MLRIADSAAILTILLIATLLGLGAYAQLELLQPGIQIFHQSDGDTGWQIYRPMSLGGSPDGAAYSQIRILHTALALGVLQAITLLALCLLRHRTGILAVGVLGALWTAAYLVAASDPIAAAQSFQSLFLNPDPMVGISFQTVLRPSLWVLYGVVIAFDVTLFETAVLCLVAVPLIALGILVYALTRLGAGPMRWPALSMVLITAVSTLFFDFGGSYRGTAMQTALGHLTLGGIATFTSCDLLLRWLETRGRYLPSGFVRATAIGLGLLLGLAIVFSVLLGRAGMPSGYLDYPETFAPLQFWSTIFTLALAAVLLAFLATILWRRLAPIRPDEISEVF